MSDISIEMALCVHQIREGLRVLRFSYLKEGYLSEEVENRIYRILFDSDCDIHAIYDQDPFKSDSMDEDDKTTQMILLICSHYEQSGKKTLI